MDKIGPYTYEQYCDKITEVHGKLAPGMLIAGFMVGLAYRNLPPNTLFEVICETAACLPDAVQLLTPCSVGNQRIRIIDVGRFAMTFYDKYTKEGVRVFLDPAKLEQWPMIKEWFLKLKPKKQQDTERLLNEIVKAGIDICGISRLKVFPDFTAKRSKTSVAICPICKEAYRSSDGPICPACKGGLLPYVVESKKSITASRDFPVNRYIE
jgi:formylmethanofuran dehydrogenase subunit E